MPLYARPVPVPSAKKGAPPPGASRPRPRQAGPQRGAAWHAIQLKAAQTAAAARGSPSRSGLPAQLKAGVEALSGLAMDDVRVHRNSPEPARLGALAYAQGSDIHLGPGQERHLPHEAWHVVQQKQGRVQATAQMKGLAINCDTGLEAEADRQGSRLSTTAAPGAFTNEAADPHRAGTARGLDAVQFQKDPATGSPPGKTNKGELTVGTEGLSGEFKQELPIVTSGPMEVTGGIRGKIALQNPGMKALTEADINEGKTAVGTELSVELKQIGPALINNWNEAQFNALKNPFNPAAYISTNVGRMSIQTSMSLLPWKLETSIKPKQDLVITLKNGKIVKASVEYFMSCALKKQDFSMREIDWAAELAKTIQAAIVIALVIDALIYAIAAALALLAPKS
jgi:hypothetical protein